jgi:hypothetical protein
MGVGLTVQHHLTLGRLAGQGAELIALADHFQFGVRRSAVSAQGDSAGILGQILRIAGIGIVGDKIKNVVIHRGLGGRIVLHHQPDDLRRPEKFRQLFQPRRFFPRPRMEKGTLARSYLHPVQGEGSAAGVLYHENSFLGVTHGYIFKGQNCFVYLELWRRKMPFLALAVP